MRLRKLCSSKATLRPSTLNSSSCSNSSTLALRWQILRWRSLSLTWSTSSTHWCTTRISSALKSSKRIRFAFLCKSSAISRSIWRCPKNSFDSDSTSRSSVDSCMHTKRSWSARYAVPLWHVPWPQSKPSKTQLKVDLGAVRNAPVPSTTTQEPISARHVVPQCQQNTSDQTSCSGSSTE